MAQRVMIAMALALEPELLIADEPTTALDVTIQAQILDLMRGLQRETGTAIILITHDLGVVAEMCDRVAVMYAGEIVEQADVATLFREPKHPYTQGLIGSIPVMGVVRDELSTIPGNVPNLIDLPAGCRFAPRCLAREPFGVDEIAQTRHPDLLPLAGTASEHPCAAGSTTTSAGAPRAQRARSRPSRDDLPASVLMPAPTLPEAIRVPETEEQGDDARYRRPPLPAPCSCVGLDIAPRPTMIRTATRANEHADAGPRQPLGTRNRPASTAGRGPRPREALPDQGRRAPADPSAWSRRWTASTSRSGAGRRWGSSANRAAGRRRWAGCCSA